MIQVTSAAIVGESGPIRALRAMIAMAAPTPLPVLIQGPTGAGKELVAEAVHRDSGRPGRFIAFNVCAIGESMFEDALFGHVRGAFTGAVSDSVGLLREADRGTAFFDEVSGLPLHLQPKLLRALERGEFRPVGGRHDVRSEFRVVCATNESLGGLTAEGRFRADLMHRVGAVVLTVPALRERIEDVPLLVRHFLQPCGAGSEDGAIQLLQEYDWPGNIRELRQVVEWAVVLGNRWLSRDAVEAALGERLGARRLDDGSPLAVERQLLMDALKRHEWRTDVVARELGIHRATLYRRIKRLRIDPGGMQALGVLPLSPTGSC